ncbi:MAG: hypothetical protein HYR96_12680 [Deltaproteobacteria bacterium]|nr:hypothetical protein [Deltaproteobacteria bacterium]MBI3295071.1 hypothetical protein [Deltaproteobacteria bacterium]
MRTFLLIILIGTIQAQALHSDLFSGNVYSAWQPYSSTDSRMRVFKEKPSGIAPYLQAGAEVLSLVQGELAPSSSVYAAPSLGYFQPNWQLHAQLRARAGLVDSSLAPDLRLMAVLDRYSSLELGGAWLVDSELYGEIVYSSWDSANAVASFLWHPSLRYLLGPRNSIGLFVEPFVSVDHVGHYYNNRTDGKLGVQYQYYDTGYSLLITAAHVWNRYLDRANPDPNPYPTASSGPQLTLTLSTP